MTRVLEPTKVTKWSRQFTRRDTERLILSGCLQDGEMYVYMAAVVAPTMFADGLCRAVWLALANLHVGAGVITLDVVAGLRYAAEDYMRWKTGRNWERSGFYRWFSGILDACPAPCMTPYHVAWLLELNKK